MMPFSIFRNWILGLFSWALLGLGLYLAYRTYEEFALADPRPDTVRVENKDRPIAIEGERPAIREDTERADWRPWALLAGVVACLGFSFGGYWPVSWLLANPQGETADPLGSMQTQQIERPDGARLHIEMFGSASAPTLLLTHGWSLDHTAWDYVKKDLAQDYRVVTWDLRGMGQSTQPANGDFSLETMARDLESVLGSATEGSVVLVGHSMGGMIQQTFCRLFPEHLGRKVQGMVLLHTTYTNPARTCLGSGVVTALLPLLIPLNYLTIALAPLAWLSNWQSYLNGSLHISSRIEGFSGKQSWQQLDHGARLAAAAWPANVARGNLEMLSFDEQPMLPQIDIPVLVIAGSDDILTLPSASEHLDSLLPEGRLYSVDSAHLGHWELATRIAEVIAEFSAPILKNASSRESASFESR